MPPNPPSTMPSLFSQLDVSADGAAQRGQADLEPLLREIRDGQDRQNELLEELVQILGTSQRQKTGELAQWKKAHPELSAQCRRAADALGGVQAEYLTRVTAEIQDNAEAMADGEFVMNEFIDRFGSRLVHLHGLCHVLSQLGSGTQTSDSA